MCKNGDNPREERQPIWKMNSSLQYREQIEAANEEFFNGLASEEQRKRALGRYFATLETICDQDAVSLAPSWFGRIKHSEEQGSRLYPSTANREYLDVLSEAGTDASDTTNTQQINSSVDLLSNVLSEKAHLLSNAKLCHVAYLHLAQAVTGVFVAENHKRRKLLNGMKGRQRRINGSGIKHSKFNKLYLKSQKQFLDSTPPALIVLPILTLDQIQNWDGVTSYSAMVLPCGPLGRQAAEDVLKYSRAHCSRDEVETAVSVLATFVHDIAESLIDVEHDIVADFDIYAGQTNDGSVYRWKELVKELRGADSPSVQIPTLKADLNFQNIRVAKGTLSRISSCLPDPFLLALKGAINYSSHAGSRLMPGCPPSKTDLVEDFSDDESL